MYQGMHTTATFSRWMNDGNRTFPFPVRSFSFFFRRFSLGWNVAHGSWLLETLLHHGPPKVEVETDTSITVFVRVRLPDNPPAFRAELAQLGQQVFPWDKEGTFAGQQISLCVV